MSGDVKIILRLEGDEGAATAEVTLSQAELKEASQLGAIEWMRYLWGAVRSQYLHPKKAA